MQFPKLNKKMLVLTAYPVACALLGLLYYKVIYIPKSRQIEKCRQELVAIQTSAQRMTEAAMKATLAARRYEDVSNRFRAMTETVPRLGNIPSTMQQIAKVGAARQVRVVSIKPDISALLEQYKSAHAGDLEVKDVEVIITAEGRFPDVGRYMFDLSDLPFFKEYGSIRVESSDDIYPRIRAKMRCTLCFI
ncbi:MAG: hypothetical protein V1736_09080 [Pseudomonadota bacterium]